MERSDAASVREDDYASQSPKEDTTGGWEDPYHFCDANTSAESGQKKKTAGPREAKEKFWKKRKRSRSFAAKASPR